MSESLHDELRARSAATLEVADPNDPATSRFPHVVHVYHSFVALEPLYTSQSQSKVFGCTTEVYKAVSQVDGRAVCIHSTPHGRGSIENATKIWEAWSSISHPNVVKWQTVFSSKVVSGIPSFFFVYDFHPCAITLQACYFESSHRYEAIGEQTLWSYILQLVSALRAIHSAGLACRVIHPCKILLTGRNRLRINGVGIMDTLAADRKQPHRTLSQLQHEDLYALGKLILALATCTDPVAIPDINRSLHLVESAYAPDLSELIRLLLKTQGAKPTIGEVVSLVAPRLIDHADLLFGHTDSLESELAKEMENGRLFRIATKLGFVNERPEFDLEPSWSETGNRYLLKLFRDYTFHQVNHDRSPNLDYSHIVETLNKLDIGSSEKIVLSARDSQSFLVVSFKDIRRCLDQAFDELLEASKRAHLHPEGI